MPSSCCSIYHVQRQLDLGLEDCVSRDSNVVASHRVVAPAPGPVQAHWLIVLHDDVDSVSHGLQHHGAVARASDAQKLRQRMRQLLAVVRVLAHRRGDWFYALALVISRNAQRVRRDAVSGSA